MGVGRSLEITPCWDMDHGLMLGPRPWGDAGDEVEDEYGRVMLGIRKSWHGCLAWLKMGHVPVSAMELGLEEGLGDTISIQLVI